VAGSACCAWPPTGERRQLLRAKLVEEVIEFLAATRGRAAEELATLSKSLLADALRTNNADLEFR
jgi:predicted house-cleaning noncanonical NTP pyrophosphatase (MazG superfamily)